MTKITQSSSSFPPLLPPLLILLLCTLAAPTTSSGVSDLHFWRAKDTRFFWQSTNQGQTSYVYLSAGYTNNIESSTRTLQNPVFGTYYYNTGGQIDEEWIRTVECPSTACQVGGLMMLHRWSKRMVFGAWADLRAGKVYVAQLRDDDGAVEKVVAMDVTDLVAFKCYGLGGRFLVVTERESGSVGVVVVSSDLQIEHRFEELSGVTLEKIDFAPVDGAEDDDFWVGWYRNGALSVNKIAQAGNILEARKAVADSVYSLSLAQKADLLVVHLAKMSPGFEYQTREIQTLMMRPGTFQVGVTFSQNESEFDKPILTSTISDDGKKVVVSIGDITSREKAIVTIFDHFKANENFEVVTPDSSGSLAFHHLRFDEEDPELVHAIGSYFSTWTKDSKGEEANSAFETFEMGKCGSGFGVNERYSWIKTLELGTYKFQAQDHTGWTKISSSTLALTSSSNDIYTNNPNVKVETKTPDVNEGTYCPSDSATRVTGLAFVSIFTFFSCCVF